MDEILVDIKNVSKRFSTDFRSSAKKGLLKAVQSFFGLNPKINVKSSSTEFNALRDVNIAVRRGETVGLIGKNGAGKSTLLKHISGIYLPDTGTIEVKGHLEGLIELGAGFHPLLSGRDNIKQRVAMLNLSSEESKELTDNIIEFSELGQFIDMPLRNYSSGMQARLGFASAVLTKPDVLLVDEVLSVGDFEFRQKCLNKINEIKQDTAILFVSHSFQTMSMFCERGIVFNKGNVVKDADIVSAIKFYMNGNVSDSNLNENENTFQGKEFLNSGLIKNYALCFIDELGSKTTSYNEEKLRLSVFIEFYEDVDTSSFRCTFGIPIWNNEGVKITAINLDKDNSMLKIENRKINKIIEIENCFNSSTILSCFALVNGTEYLLRRKLPPLKIDKYHPREDGLVQLSYEVKNV